MTNGENMRADNPTPPPFVRLDLVPRTIYFPPNFLARYDTAPGQLIETLTEALTRFVRDEKGGTQ